MPQPAITLAATPAAKTCLALILGENEGVSAGFAKLTPAAIEEVKTTLSALSSRARAARRNCSAAPLALTPWRWP